MRPAEAEGEYKGQKPQGCAHDGADLGYLRFVGFTLVILSYAKAEYGLEIGNIVGSSICNLLAFIGAATTIAPIQLQPVVLSLHIFVMVAFTLALFAMTYDYDGKSELSRIEGIALLVACLVYDAYVAAQDIHIDLK